MANELPEIPRRLCVDKMTPAELAIREASLAVEAAGADLRLTQAVMLLQAAREKVADFVDGVEATDSHPHPPTPPAAMAPPVDRDTNPDIG